MNKVKNVSVKERVSLIKNNFSDNNINFNESMIDTILDYTEIESSIRGNSLDKHSLRDEILCVLESLSKKEIPEKYTEEILSSITLRFKVIPIQGYALISKDWIVPLANWIGNRKCLEIMAGKGTLSYALQCQGKSVIATDGYKWSQFDFSNLWTDVEELDALDAIEKYGKDVDIIIMSWCYMDELGYKSLLKMREVNPNAIMLYIGESWGGCTGSDSLYENMIEIEDSDIESINSIYPNWMGIYDKLFLIK